ncbi:unnamed protein product [Arctogadus glacialis]
MGGEGGLGRGNGSVIPTYTLPSDLPNIPPPSNPPSIAPSLPLLRPRPANANLPARRPPHPRQRVPPPPHMFKGAPKDGGCDLHTGHCRSTAVFHYSSCWLLFLFSFLGLIVTFFVFLRGGRGFLSSGHIDYTPPPPPSPSVTSFTSLTTSSTSALMRWDSSFVFLTFLYSFVSGRILLMFLFCLI